MYRSIALISIITLLLLSVPSASSAISNTADPLLQDELNELLVVWDNDGLTQYVEMKHAFDSRAQQLFGSTVQHDDITVTPTASGSFVRVRLRDMDTRAFAASLRTSGAKVVVEENQLVRALMVPNDPYYAPHQWNLRMIGMAQAWDQAAGGEGVTVALIDSGIAYENSGSFRQAPEFTETIFVEGYDFIGNDPRPNDENGHGTHIASILAATTNNSIGIAGVAPGVRIMPLKILNRYGQGTLADLAEAIRWAADHGADVINMSVGVAESSEILRDALHYAYEKGVVMVAAAGNDGSSTLMYPAAVHDYVIAVGAVDARGERASYSNTGDIDLLAPGGSLNADVNGDGYGDGVLGQTFVYRGRFADTRSFAYTFAQGTSVAAPHVTGVAAMIVGLGIDDPDAVREILRDSATDLGQRGWDSQHGAGLLDAARALTLAKNPLQEPPSILIEPLTEQQHEPSSPLTVPPPVSNAPAEDAAPHTPPSPPAVQEEPAPHATTTEEHTPPAETQAPQRSLHAELKILNAFGRAVDSLVWWETPRVQVSVSDQNGTSVSGAEVEIRFRNKGEQNDLGSRKGVTPSNGTVEFILSTFPRKSVIEVGVLATNDGINSELQMKSFTIR